MTTFWILAVEPDIFVMQSTLKNDSTYTHTLTYAYMHTHTHVITCMHKHAPFIDAYVCIYKIYMPCPHTQKVTK